MPSPKAFSEILEKVITSDDVALLQSEIDTLKKSLFTVGEDGFDAAAKTQVRAWVGQAVSDQGGSTIKSRESYLIQLAGELKKLPVIHLSIAVEPTYETLNNIHAWLLRELNSNFILELEYDPGLIGGAIITYQGKYHDGSLKTQLEEVYAQL